MPFRGYEELEEVSSSLLFLVSPKDESMGLPADERSVARVWLAKYGMLAYEGGDSVRSTYLILRSPGLRVIERCNSHTRAGKNDPFA